MRHTIYLQPDAVLGFYCPGPYMFRNEPHWRYARAWIDIAGPLAEGACPWCLKPLQPQTLLERATVFVETLDQNAQPRGTPLPIQDVTMTGDPACCCCMFTWTVDPPGINPEGIHAELGDLLLCWRPGQHIPVNGHGLMTPGDTWVGPVDDL